jgi:undecaprenyl-diphosphatase
MNLIKIKISMYIILICVSTYLAIYRDAFIWEITFSKWLQTFSLGNFSFLRESIFFMGIRGVAGVIMILLFGSFWLSKKRTEALFLALISVPDLINIWLKEIIGRPRPSQDMIDVVVGYGGIQGSGFPSGHALHVVLFYGFICYLMFNFLGKRTLTITVLCLTIAYILITGLWLIYDGRHWIMDVLGGYLYGLFYLYILILLYRSKTSKISSFSKCEES